jgi:beta-lactamase class D
MKTKLFLFLLLFYSSVFSQIDFSKIKYDSVFSNYNGLFLVSDTSGQIIFSYNSELDSIRKSPCSTFKILNSLIALESGSIKNENSLIKWDSIKRWNDDWNKDHTLKSAFANSVVWYYQELARRTGPEKMKHYLDLCKYGNADISDGIDKFWLGSSLKISAIEQLQFIKNIYKEELPFKSENYTIVKNIMIYSKGENFVLRGKTGSNGEDLGWFIGYIECDKSVYIFVSQLNGKEASGLKARKMVMDIFRNVLKIKL